MNPSLRLPRPRAARPRGLQDGQAHTGFSFVLQFAPFPPTLGPDSIPRACACACVRWRGAEAALQEVPREGHEELGGSREAGPGWEAGAAASPHGAA